MPKPLLQDVASRDASPAGRARERARPQVGATGALMRLLPMLICGGLLAGCQGSFQPTDASALAAAHAPVRTCSLLGPATVVRYRTRIENHSQHEVQLLNGATGREGGGCMNAAPLASVVTLRYRVADG